MYRVVRPKQRAAKIKLAGGKDFQEEGSLPFFTSISCSTYDSILPPTPQPPQAPLLTPKFSPLLPPTGFSIGLRGMSAHAGEREKEVPDA